MKEKIFRYVIFIIGGLLGVIILPKLLHISIDFGAFIGVIFSLVVVLLIPSTRKNYSQELEKSLFNPERLTFWQYCTHPTQLPMTLGMIGFVCILGVLLLLGEKLNSNVPFWLITPAILLAGFSGLIIVIRKEYVNRHWVVVQSKWAILWGILYMLVFWGSGIILLLSTTFGW